MSLPHSTTKSRVAFFGRTSDYPTPDANPDGQYWQLGVQSLQATLTELIGRENYQAWAELVWPDDTVDKLTWKEMYQQLDRTIEAIMSRHVDGLMNWADAAQDAEQSVPGCYGLPD